MNSMLLKKVNSLSKKRLIKLLFFLALLFVLFNYNKVDASDENTKYVYIEAVVDGDTIIAKGGAQIRYTGIDAPELGQPYSLKAKRLNKKLVLHKYVRLEYDVKKYDYQKRELAYVYTKNHFVNKVLIRQGMARMLTVAPNVRHRSELKNARNIAQQKNIGIWPIFDQIVWQHLPTIITPF